MAIGTDSNTSFMARRLEDLAVVDAAQRDDAISVDFAEDDEDFEIESAMELATSYASTAVPPMHVEIAEVAYGPASPRQARTADPLVIAEPPLRAAVEAQKSAPRTVPWRTIVAHMPAVGVGVGLAVAAVADGTGPALVRYAILGAGLALGAAWVGLQRKEPSSRWLRIGLWVGLLAAALLPAALTALTPMSFRGAGMGYVIVGLLGAVAQMFVGATAQTDDGTSTPNLAMRPSPSARPRVFHPDALQD